MQSSADWMNWRPKNMSILGRAARFDVFFPQFLTYRNGFVITKSKESEEQIAKARTPGCNRPTTCQSTLDVLILITQSGADTHFFDGQGQSNSAVKRRRETISNIVSQWRGCISRKIATKVDSSMDMWVTLAAYGFFLKASKAVFFSRSDVIRILITESFSAASDLLDRKQSSFDNCYWAHAKLPEVFFWPSSQWAFGLLIFFRHKIFFLRVFRMSLLSPLITLTSL